MKPVVITHEYDAPADAVWQIATEYASFAEAMKGVATFEGMPQEGRLSGGEQFDVKVRLFGWMPPMDYHMNVVGFDPVARSFRSVEHGGAIKRWEHRLSVVPNGAGATLTDHVTIDAGLSTGIMRLWARFVYRRRHAPRLRMLERLKNG